MYMSGKIVTTQTPPEAGKARPNEVPGGNSTVRDPLSVTSHHRTAARFAPAPFRLAPRADDPAEGVPLDCTTLPAVPTCLE